ncbi:MAG: MFS transporter [Deltaproteobacteria bacterium]|nr:MFS transporter [Deltaproteobacteria bacterium]
MSQASATNLARLWGVVRDNKAYRRLFAANLVSQLGDWFSTVALFSLMLELTGRGESVALVLVCHLMPMFFAGPIAGVVADRFDRRFILVAADLSRALVVLGFLLIRKPEHAVIAYALVATRSVFTAFFEPAQQATFPNLVDAKDLVVASALENSVWATTLALGSALGGILMLYAGRPAIFVINAGTYLCSALLLRGLPDRVARAKVEEKTVRPPGWRSALGITDFLEGLRYLGENARVRALVLAKGGFGLTLGGVLVLLAFFGEKVFVEAGQMGIPMLWTARGIGSFVGPFIAWRLGGDSPPALRRGVTIAFGLVCLSYLLFARAPTLLLAAPVLMIANSGGSILWTYASSIQALIVPDALRGRVAAADMGWMTLTMASSDLLTGHLVDAGVPPRWLMAGCGLVAIVPITYWIMAQRHFRDPLLTTAQAQAQA